MPDLGLLRCPISQIRCPIGQWRCPMGLARCPIGQARCPIGRARCSISLGRCPILRLIGQLVRPIEHLACPIGHLARPISRPPASEGGASLVLHGWTQWPDTSGHCVPASAPVLHFNPYSTVDITATIYNGQPSTLTILHQSTAYPPGLPSPLPRITPSDVSHPTPSR